MTARGRAVAAVVVVACLWCAGVRDLQLALLYLGPVLLLATALAANRYPGERLLLRIRRRPRRRPAARAGDASTPRAPTTVVARGGLLLARALAGRAPPLRLLTG